MKSIFSICIAFLLLNIPTMSQPRVGSGYAEINGTRLYYEIAGQGTPIVFIHGNFGDRRHWDLQFKELSKKYKVLRYDQRGYGRSAMPDSIQPYKDADDLNALMSFLKIEKAHICGLSSGSFIVIDFGLAYPAKCLSLIPIGPRVAGDDLAEYKTPATDSLSAVVSRVIGILKTTGKKAAIDYLWKADHCFGRSLVSSATRNSLLKMGYDYTWWRYLHPTKREYTFPAAIKKLNEINIPTLVVTAEYDLEKCKEVAAILAKGIQKAKLISIKRAGHIMNMDQPKKFNTIISRHIDKLKL